jgi:hypothetical protein
LYKKSSSAEFEMPLISAIGAVEMGQVVCLDPTAYRVRKRQRRQRLYAFRVVVSNFWPAVKIVALSRGTTLRPPSMGEATGVAVAWCSHGFVSFPTLMSPISFGWIVTLQAMSEIPR